MAWVKAQVRDLDLGSSRVLEVGSFDVNGTVRPLFEGAAAYVGVDVAPGPGVDVVVAYGKLPFESAAFDVVVSTEMLEHDRKPWRTAAEMVRVLRRGGRLLATARGFDEGGAFPFHNPPDRWRFSEDGMRALLEDAGAAAVEVLRDPQVRGWFARAARP